MTELKYALAFAGLRARPILLTTADAAGRLAIRRSWADLEGEGRNAFAARTIGGQTRLLVHACSG